MADVRLILIPSDYAQHRMRQRGLNEAQVKYAIEHYETVYNDDPYIGYVSVLPTGQNIKVKIKEFMPEFTVDGVQIRVVEIVDAFTFA